MAGVLIILLASFVSIGLATACCASLDLLAHSAICKFFDVAFTRPPTRCDIALDNMIFGNIA